MAIAGSIFAEGFATHARLDGTLGLDALVTKTLPYDFTFRADDDRVYRFFGKKTLHATSLVADMTVLPAQIEDASGTPLYRAVLRFDLEKDLASFLRSFHLR